MRDDELLECRWWRGVENDYQNFELRSRYFDDWKLGFHFTALDMMQLPAEVDLSRSLLAALRPIFQGLSEAPFSPRLVKQLLGPMIEPLVYDWRRGLLERTNYTQLNRGRYQVVEPGTFGNAVRNFAVQGVGAAIQAADFESNFRIFDDVVDAAGRDMERAIMFGGTLHSGFSSQAIKRSRKMLLQHLTVQQKEMFEKHQRFEVQGSNGRVYEILHTNNFNIRDKITRNLYCVVPAESCPLYDKLMASKLWLETNAEEVLRKANKTRDNGYSFIREVF